MAAPRPTLGHYRGDSLTHPMLITAFYIFDPKVTGSLVAVELLSWNFTKFWYQASSYYSEHRMPSPVCIKFILYYQKWSKLPLRISSETSFFSRQLKLSALVDKALHFPKKHQSRFPLQPLVLFQLLCLHSWRTDLSACILIVTYCSFKGFSLSKNYQVVEAATGGVL